MEFNDYGAKIWASVGRPLLNDDEYGEHIKKLDLGIEYDHTIDYDGTDVYVITDKKKWLLTKIKYGI